MELKRNGWLTAVVITGALALTACSGNDPVDTGGDGADTNGSSSNGDGGAELSGEISAGGASSQEAAMQAWIAGFNSEQPDVTVNYDAIGSGGGRTNFIEGAYPFAGTDAVLDEEETAQATERCGGEPPIHLPMYISPIAIVYNIEGVDDLQLSGPTIAGIFNQEITNWNDPAIAEDNPDAELPDLPISPVNRSDESGTTENFLEYLSAVGGDAWPHEVSGDWPVSGGQSGQGTSGVVQTVSGGNGTIGYADASQAGDLGVAKVQVGDEYVEYSPEAAAAVVDASPRIEGASEHDLAFDLDRTSTESGTYPIVLISYTITCQTHADESEAELTKAFLSYMASPEGQEQAASAAGSAPITDEMRSNVEAALDTISASS